MYVEPRNPDQAPLSPFPLSLTVQLSPHPRPLCSQSAWERATESFSLPVVPRRRLPFRAWRTPRVLGPLVPVRSLDGASLWSLRSSPRAARRQTSLSHLLSSALPIQQPLHRTTRTAGRSGSWKDLGARQQSGGGDLS